MTPWPRAAAAYPQTLVCDMLSCPSLFRASRKWHIFDQIFLFLLKWTVAIFLKQKRKTELLENRIFSWLWVKNKKKSEKTMFIYFRKIAILFEYEVKLNKKI